MKKFTEWLAAKNEGMFDFFTGGGGNPRKKGEFAKAYEILLKKSRGDENMANQEFDRLMADQAGKYKLMTMANPVGNSKDEVDPRYVQGWQAANRSGSDMMR